MSGDAASDAMAAARSERKRHALELFSGLPARYDALSALLSFGQDPRWRRALVRGLGPARLSRVLDVATGTGLVAAELVRQGAREVVALDQSDAMLAAASRRFADRCGGVDGASRDVAARGSARVTVLRGEAEALPFEDQSFDGLTFTYLLRYVDDPAAVMRELARVLLPGGRIASLEFGVPAAAPARAAWRAYTAVGLPLCARIVSRSWGDVGSFLGPSIAGFYERHPIERIVGYWRDAGLRDVEVRRMSLGGGVLMFATRDGHAGEGTPGAEAPERMSATPQRPAFYALGGGRVADFVTLLHPPYTAWHLSYFALGAAVAPTVHVDRLVWGLVAFGLAVGVAAHALDELHGRPLNTKLSNRALIAMAVAASAGAVAIGVAGVLVVSLALAPLVLAGALFLPAYNLELANGRFHSDLWFALGWGGFPAFTGYFVNALRIAPAGLLVAAGCVAMSVAQRRLSTPARELRRRTSSVEGVRTTRDGRTERLSLAGMLAPLDGALAALALAVVALACAALAARL